VQTPRRLTRDFRFRQATHARATRRRLAPVWTVWLAAVTGTAGAESTMFRSMQRSFDEKTAACFSGEEYEGLESFTLPACPRKTLLFKERFPRAEGVGHLGGRSPDRNSFWPDYVFSQRTSYSTPAQTVNSNNSTKRFSSHPLLWACRISVRETCRANLTPCSRDSPLSRSVNT
jgi:hypothetical protein